jgi:peptide deformylase
MALVIRMFGDPVLKTRASPVGSFDGSLSNLVEEMLATMHEYDGVGLAANQVGRLKRILVAAVEEEKFVVINPIIEESAGTTEKDLEGCLSIPGIHVEVERPTAVTVSGQNATGAPLRIEATGLLARILQHEIDHLDGVLILDRTDRESRKAAMREIRERLVAGKELTGPADKL